MRGSVIGKVFYGSLCGWECSTFLDRRRWSQRGGGAFLCRMRVICHIGRLTDAQTTGDSSSYVSLQDASEFDRR